MKKFLIFLILPLLSGCVASHGNFTVLSNKLIDVKNFDLDSAPKIKNVEGVDKSRLIVVFPTKANPNLNDALNDAFRKTDTDLMTDVEIKTFGWYIPYIYGEMGWKVKGDAVKTRSNFRSRRFSY